LRILTLDIGTSSVRATVFTERLRRLRPAVRIPYTWQMSADASVELPASKLERIVQSAIDAALERAGAIDVVSTAAFWHSLVGIDRGGRAVTPVLPWTDTRASTEATALREQLDEAAVHARTGCRLHPTYWPARLLWFRNHDPRTFDRVRRWMSFPAYLQRRWLGRDAESISQASGTGIFADGAWDTELCGVCGVEPSQLGEIVDVDRKEGGLRGREARRWPALAGARWLPPLGDGAVNNAGAGCADGACAALMVGTSGALRLAWSTNRAPAVPLSLWRYWLDRKRVVIGGALSNGGNLVAWLGETLCVPIDRKLDAALARMPPDAHGLTVLPFLAGERSPGYLPDASGIVAGLRLATSRHQIIRAALESVAYRFLGIFDALNDVRRVERLVATGTALRSSGVWVQILADVLDRQIALPSEGELTSRGAAIVALEALGVPDAAPPLHTSRTVTPDHRAHAIYRAAAERQHLLSGRFAE
jgi:gluconokinase